MIRALTLCSVATAAHCADLMHVPILCKYSDESHAIAGALVAVGASCFMDEHTPVITRLTASVGLALVAGTVKEYLIDHHARPREIPAWGIGAAAVVAFQYTFHF